MKIQLPKSDWPLIRLEVKCPEGSFTMTFGEPYSEAVFDIPDDMPEDVVEVTAVWLDAGNKPVGNVMVLKEAVEPEPELEEDDEDTPDEDDEEADPSLPSEETDESPEAEVEVRELPAPRELGDWEADAKDANDRDDGRYELGCS